MDQVCIFGVTAMISCVGLNGYGTVCRKGLSRMKLESRGKESIEEQRAADYFRARQWRTGDGKE